MKSRTAEFPDHQHLRKYFVRIIIHVGFILADETHDLNTKIPICREQLRLYGWQSVASKMSDWCHSDIVMGIRTVSAPVAQLNRQAIGNIAEGPPL